MSPTPGSVRTAPGRDGEPRPRGGALLAGCSYLDRAYSPSVNCSTVLESDERMYETPKLSRFGTFRDLTQLGQQQVPGCANAVPYIYNPNCNGGLTGAARTS